LEGSPSPALLENALAGNQARLVKFPIWHF
jgi:hypothetical protein